MAQFHTTVLTLLHGSAKEAYEVLAAKEAATERREELAEQQTETWYLTHAEPTEAVRAAKKKTYFDAITEFVEEDFEVGLTKICNQLLPFQALIKVKRYLRRHCHKPASMTIRQYVSHIRKINEHELPLLVTFIARVRELKAGLGITEEKQMAQFHTTVLTLLHGSAKEAYQVAVSETAETRRLAEAEEGTIAFLLMLLIHLRR